MEKEKFLEDRRKKRSSWKSLLELEKFLLIFCLCCTAWTSTTCFTSTVHNQTFQKTLEIFWCLQRRFESPIMSCEVHLERQKKANLRAGTSSAPVFAPRVPTVTLISHRELRDKHTAHRLPPGSFDSNLPTSSHYRCSEGRSFLLKGPVLWNPLAAC